jgi:hypothetical protein
MGFPASGVESAYRNDIGHVAEMLNGMHILIHPPPSTHQRAAQQGLHAWRVPCMQRLTYVRRPARHFMHYMIWNLSQRPYDYGLFHDMIQPLGWPDHHAPALSLLFRIVSAMDSYATHPPQTPRSQRPHARTHDHAHAHRRTIMRMAAN